MKFVQRRAGRYEFRFPLPDDLAGKPIPHFCPEALAALVNARAGLFKTELIRSLQTDDRLTAERRVLTHIAEAHGLVDQARRCLRDGPAADISSDQIVAMARDHEIHLLGADEAIRAKGMGLDLSREEDRPHDGLGMTDDDLRGYRMLVGELVGARTAKLTGLLARLADAEGSTMDDRTVARGLAWFGIGLGLVELAAPRELARAIGLPGHERTIQIFGLREIASGVVMLASDEPESRLGLRVGGDLLDGGLLSTGLAASNPERTRTLMATLAAAPVVALDVTYWLRARSRCQQA